MLLGTHEVDQSRPSRAEVVSLSGRYLLVGMTCSPKAQAQCVAPLRRSNQQLNPVKGRVQNLRADTSSCTEGMAEDLGIIALLLITYI